MADVIAPRNRKANRAELLRLEMIWKVTKGVTVDMLGDALGRSGSYVSRAIRRPGKLTLRDLDVLWAVIEAHGGKR